ncbi:transporter substrate-binding domain-containing protein [Ensifer sp. SSB1]|jgi:octopine/nopaline transport system substrate-binding protein|uniref:transporter substrate-binding domain-containing protein n=1 Tax=Ensifer sp. SSB1 TaxID=2795385 RepID=UPI001A45E45A|nr:transporter substrate-binding domain-containing protein [Ensifer sp. SSB1]MBK5570736.1 transporter substrate-binding domain-containing protein [Ensifer sp. SSB1]
MLKSLGKTIIALGVALGASAAQAEERTITIATEGAYAPWNFTEAGGKLAGYEIDMLEDICPRMKVKCDIVVQDWDGLIPSLNAGKFDAIVAGMLQTEEREKVITFSRNYGTGSAAFLVRKDSPLAKMPVGKQIDMGKDKEGAKAAAAEMLPFMDGIVIGVQGSTTAGQIMTELFPGVEFREYKSTEQHDLDLQAGRIDGVMASPVALDRTLEKIGADQVMFAGTEFTGGPLGGGQSVGLRDADTELKAKFDDAINAAIADGTLSRLAIKWFKRDISPKK